MEETYKRIKESEGLIYSIAKKYSSYNDIDDLYQAGSIGVIKAINKYDKNSNVKFSTYAYKYILGEIIDFIRKNKAIIVSDEAYDIYKKYIKIRDLLSSKLQREVSFSEICSYMGIEEKQMICIIESVSYSKSIDDNLYDTVSNDYRNIIDNEILLSNEIETLNDFDKSIINYRYYEGYTQDETAKIMGISQAKASRCEKLILQRMRENIAN